MPGDLPSATGGAYDYRGPACIKAVADVVRWISGDLLDGEGLTLAGHLDAATPLAGLTGLVGFSNGGNLTLSAMATGGPAMAKVGFVVNWESPVGDGMVDVEAGGAGNTNPAYDPDTGAWDLSHLVWSDALRIGRTGPSFTGGFSFDLDGDGVLDLTGPGADFPLQPLIASASGTGAVQAFWSVRVVAEAEARGLIPATRPAHLPTAEETRTFWSTRDASNQLAALAAAHPDLLFLVIGSEQDHVQGALDHPHVLAQYEGLRSRGVWSRLNPDAAYLAAFGPAAGARDNAANMPFDHMTIRAALDPESIPIATAIEAGVAELADRLRAGDRTANLSAVL